MDGAFPNEMEVGVRAGSLLSLAASEVDAARRCLVAALIHMDQADVEPDTSMVTLMVGLQAICREIENLVDKDGLQQVRRRFG